MKKLVLLMKKSSHLSFCSQNGILLKGGALPPGSIRVWGGKEYIKIAPGKWRLRSMQKKEGANLQNKVLTLKEKADVKAFLLGNPIIQVEEGVIKADENGTAIENAKRWAKNHSQEIIRTDIGTVIFDAGGVRNSLSHKFSQRKLDAIQAIPTSVEAGKIVSISDDFDGKPIKNVILAAPIKIGNNERSFLFIRLVKNVGSDNRLYVHEVFDMDDLKNTAIPFQTPGTDLTARPQRGIAIYINILRDILDVKEK